MAHVSFYLKSYKTAKTLPIIMQVSIKFSVIVDGKRRYQQVRISTGMSIPQKQWAGQRAAVKSDKKNKIEACPIAYEMNRRLDEAQAIALRMAFEAEKNGDSIDSLKTQLNGSHELMRVFGKRVKTDDVFGWIQTHIDGKDVKSSTRAQLCISLEKMRAFDLYRRAVSTWSDFDYNYYQLYIGFLRGRGLKENSIGKHIKDLKMFLRAAKQAKKEVPDDFMTGAFKKPSEKVDSVYLTDEEVSKIASVRYQDGSGIEVARIWFLIGCNTGLRVSDLMRLSPDNIQGSNIVVRTIKTGADVVIPMTKQLKGLIKNGFPRPITSQRYNDYIKEICRDAGIDKWKKVSSHTARRSFATNMYQMGVPAANLMLITGHTTESSFYKYIRTGLGENADLMREKFPELFE